MQFETGMLYTIRGKFDGGGTEEFPLPKEPAGSGFAFIPAGSNLQKGRK